MKSRRFWIGMIKNQECGISIKMCKKSIREIYHNELVMHTETMKGYQETRYLTKCEASA